MYIVVPIQQGTHITNLLNILLLGYYCVSHIRITWLYQQAPYSKTKKQKAKDAYKCFACIKSYKLQDSQLYCKAKTNKRTRITYLA
jgi:uncharacterized paraquat-inducible protein A